MRNNFDRSTRVQYAASYGERRVVTKGLIALLFHFQSAPAGMAVGGVGFARLRAALVSIGSFLFIEARRGHP